MVVRDATTFAGRSVSERPGHAKMEAPEHQAVGRASQEVPKYEGPGAGEHPRLRIDDYRCR